MAARHTPIAADLRFVAIMVGTSISICWLSDNGYPARSFRPARFCRQRRLQKSKDPGFAEIELAGVGWCVVINCMNPLRRGLQRSASLRCHATAGMRVYTAGQQVSAPLRVDAA